MFVDKIQKASREKRRGSERRYVRLGLRVSVLSVHGRGLFLDRIEIDASNTSCNVYFRSLVECVSVENWISLVLHGRGGS